MNKRFIEKLLSKCITDESRPENQIWISETMESPPRSINYFGLKENGMTNLFNWTAYALEKATIWN